MSAPEFDVLVAGEVNPDLVLSGDVTPVFGQVEKMVTDARLTVGGSASIFACGAARLGLRVALAGVVGDDAFGRFMREQLAQRGVDVGAVRVDPGIRTGLSVILSTGDDRAILTYGGSIPQLTVEAIPAGLLRRAHHLHVTSFYMLDRLRPEIPSLFAQAHALGLTTSLDTNYDPSGRWQGGLSEALAHTDIFFPNRAELLAISGVASGGVASDGVASDGDGIVDENEALARLTGDSRTVAAKLGADGAIARRGPEQARAPALAVSVVDAVGAGDSFDAGFIYAHLHGWALARALRLACACGSLSTRAPGGVDGQPTLAEALAAIAPS